MMEVKNNQGQIEDVEYLQRQEEVISALQKKSDKKSDEWGKKPRKFRKYT
ncbi:MAG: hypothetical protein LUG86_04890 [Oscillospiraceae bacterium]|nr:hypothetical protein [Oscillospiraceae bacterium]